MDKYDKAIKYLTKNPNEILDNWDCAGNGYEREASCLFSPCNKEGSYETPRKYCGCLTQVHGHAKTVAQHKRMTERIKADDRIPSNGEDIRVSDLPIFALWQRRIDKALNRV